MHELADAFAADSALGCSLAIATCRDKSSDKQAAVDFGACTSTLGSSDQEVLDDALVLRNERTNFRERFLLGHFFPDLIGLFVSRGRWMLPAPRQDIIRAVRANPDGGREGHVMGPQFHPGAERQNSEIKASLLSCWTMGASAGVLQADEDGVTHRAEFAVPEGAEVKVAIATGFLVLAKQAWSERACGSLTVEVRRGRK